MIARLQKRPKLEKQLSVREFLALPPDEQGRSELVYGAHVVSPSPSEFHNDLAHLLGEILRRWTQHHKLGKVGYDVDMILNEEDDLVYRPDLWFVSESNEKRRQGGRLFGAADLCVEILSASDKPWLRNRKFSDYESYGVSWYWVIWQNADPPFIEEYELRSGVYVLRSEVTGDVWFEPGLFPGLVFSLPRLMEGDLKKAVKGKAKKLV